MSMTRPVAPLRLDRGEDVLLEGLGDGVAEIDLDASRAASSRCCRIGIWPRMRHAQAPDASSADRPCRPCASASSMPSLEAAARVCIVEMSTPSCTIVRATCARDAGQDRLRRRAGARRRSS